jgi:hypothetical protein
MVCQRCGRPVEGAFCSNCGVPVQPPPAVYGAGPVLPPPGAYGASPVAVYIPRVGRHLQTLGILWCVYGIYRAAAATFAVLFLMGVATPSFFGYVGGRGVPFLPFAPVMSGLAAVAGVFILITSCLAFATAYALMTRKPWGRTLAIVVAIISLIKLPVGTALGIYTLWVLAPGASGAEYDAIADHS